ncbi:MAG: 4'-phosphopantetheinyl transferase superfamily protein [Chloroflexi bacterium]|nr:4'-phosphopantetheinyl transferase superfamily protein [Chloroflexota bacterium]
MAFQNPPTQLQTEPGWVHIFSLALDLPEDRLRALRELLDDEERSRANRFYAAQDRRRFIAAHGQMRQILGRYCCQPPNSLRFDKNAYGKPFLRGIPELRFNLSHSLDRGLLAISGERELGVDVEACRSLIDQENIARRFFAPGEVKELFSLPPEQQKEAFFACWTRKEAYVKARGKGLSIPLDQFEVSLRPGEKARLIKPAENWSLYSINVGPGFAAALAVEGSIDGLRLWKAPG